MIFITGGVFQGKEAFAREAFQAKETVEAAEACAEQLERCGCILNYHRIVRRQVEAGEDALSAARELLKKNPEVILTMDEVGCGAVPMEKAERLYREEVGRVGSYFAKEAKAVYRVVCGIPQQLA